MTLYNPMEKRKIIMERYYHPKFKGTIKNIEPIKRFSTQCVDKLDLYLRWEKDILKDAKHDSVGCAVFLSSTDLFLEKIIGKTKQEICDITKHYDLMINKMGVYDKDMLGKLVIFDNVKTHLNRLLCANMVSELIKSILK